MTNRFIRTFENIFEANPKTAKILDTQKIAILIIF